jgi:hypothetical protein
MGSHHAVGRFRAERGKMRKFFNLSWPQIPLLLGLAAVIAWVPEITFPRFALIGSLIAVAALGVVVKVTGNNRGDGERQDDKGMGH